MSSLFGYVPVGDAITSRQAFAALDTKLRFIQLYGGVSVERDQERNPSSIEDQEGFKRACNIYLFQNVYDTKQRKAVPLNPITEFGLFSQRLDYLGLQADDVKVQKIAEGEASPSTWKEYYAIQAPVCPRSFCGVLVSNLRGLLL